ncbi:MAG: hypothetical protein AAGH79_13500, partial [Bacteroidota bacterium]
WLQVEVTPIEFDQSLQITKYLFTITLDKASPLSSVREKFPKVGGPYKELFSSFLQDSLISSNLLLDRTLREKENILTQKEEEVLLLYLNNDGMTRSRAAHALAVRSDTIRDYCQSIKKKTSAYIGLELESINDLKQLALNLSFYSKVA